MSDLSKNIIPIAIGGSILFVVITLWKPTAVRRIVDATGKTIESGSKIIEIAGSTAEGAAAWLNMMTSIFITGTGNFITDLFYWNFVDSDWASYRLRSAGYSAYYGFYDNLYVQENENQFNIYFDTMFAERYNLHGMDHENYLWWMALGLPYYDILKPRYKVNKNENKSASIEGEILSRYGYFKDFVNARTHIDGNPDINFLSKVINSRFVATKTIPNSAIISSDGNENLALISSFKLRSYMGKELGNNTINNLLTDDDYYNFINKVKLLKNGDFNSINNIFYLVEKYPPKSTDFVSKWMDDEIFEKTYLIHKYLKYNTISQDILNNISDLLLEIYSRYNFSRMEYDAFVNVI